MPRICLLTIILFKLLLQITFIHASPKNITLSLPQTKIPAQIGEEIHITCEAFTCDKPEFTWASLMDSTLSGTVTTLGQRSTLTMKVNIESEGSYRCAVSCNKPSGEKSFKIIVYSFPMKPILNISSVVYGEESHITCTFPNVYPSYMMTAQIRLDDEIVADYDGGNGDIIQTISLSHNFLLSEVYDGKKIQCMGEMAFEDPDIESMKSHTTMDLHLMYPPVKPEIAIYPSTTVRAGDKVTLSCSSESGSQVIIQWMKLIDGKESEMSSDAQGSLILPCAEPEDSGVYICYAKNNVGNTSSHVEISVQDPPKNTSITIAPSHVVFEGGFVHISCTSEAFPIPTIVLKIKTDQGLNVLESQDGQYNITHAGMEHIGAYICEATNEIGQQSAETTLSVQVPPKNTDITIVPSAEVREGDHVQIICTSLASPAPRLILKRKTEHSLTVLDSQDGQYNITHAAMEHIGAYICEATNDYGQQSAETTLSVQVPPKNTNITITPSAVVKEGDSVWIKCTSEASPDPRVVLIINTQDSMMELELDNGLYNITYAEMEHAGSYICHSSNSFGEQISEITLVVQIPSTTVVTTLSQNVTHNVTSNRMEGYKPTPGFQSTPVIIGSVACVSAASVIGVVIYYVRQAKAQGSYNLV